MLERGLYEAIITQALESELVGLAGGKVARRTPLDPADAADRLALHVARIVERAITDLPEEDRVASALALVRRLVEMICESTSNSRESDGLLAEQPVVAASVLQAVLERRPDGSAEEIPGPLTPLLDTTLLTNAPGEPRIGAQIRTEICSADRIDVVMAFIRRSGIAPLRDVLQRHCDAGRPLRILTTTYTGSTEADALDQLAKLGADVRVSYDRTSTRLHAKSWLFHRASKHSTAYIGSSNLTHSAQVSGLEWNLRVSETRNPTVIEKVAAVFDAYWHGGDFAPYERERFLAEIRPDRSGARLRLSPVEVRLEPFQDRLLESIAVARRAGRHRNLLVSATGTGKTVMAAVDYQRLTETMQRCRLLFVAHRKEILEQSLATFRHVMRTFDFGETWVGGTKPSRFDHVFASIQSLDAAGYEHLDPEWFDVVIVDEFHHAAANSYRRLLDHVRPRELLGLTATPERSDGLTVLDWFDGRIAAELRLWDAIDQHRLVPFCYFGIHDGTDLSAVGWVRGRGYVVEGLTNVYTADDVVARLVVKEIASHVDDVSTMRALGFCVSVDHARYMARVFGECGIAATAIWADTPADERRRSLDDLAARRINALFSVDLFNEGVDVPEVDTLLLLRPTESPTLFLQQLGRGLRRHDSKTMCTVLDFVGRHRVEFRFDRRFQALLGGTRKDVVSQIESGFPLLPAGCHMQLDPVARDIVLANIKSAVPSHWSAKVEELRRFVHSGRSPALGAFLDESGLDLEDVYVGNKSWSDLLHDAGCDVLDSGPHESPLRRSIARLRHVDDALRLDAYREWLSQPTPPPEAALSVSRARLLRMMTASIMGPVVTKQTTIDEALELLWRHPQVLREATELFSLLSSRIERLGIGVSKPSDVPLSVHSRYTRVEILAAFGVGSGAKVSPWQTGVYHIPATKTDLFAFTLDKSSGRFSPTTRYRDYAISRDLIHWESQSVTREDSETGRRYREHEMRGGAIVLFARINVEDRAFYCLGPANYVSHVGELPMAVKWRLEHPLPGDLFQSFAVAVA